jgi:transcriptional antiterminator RfaH
MTGHPPEGCADPGAWIAITTHPHKERVAVMNLGQQGFRTYCPMIRRRTSHARKLRDVFRPLFPGYIFVRLDVKRDQWRPILSTIGVRTLVRFGDKLGMVPEGFVSALQDREEDGAVRLPPARDAYVPGEKVRLRNGPFAGLVATVLASSDCERLSVLMEMLTRSVRVRLPIEDVVPA